MKRAISLSFLLLASMIILAHAFIPHHHHDDVVHVVAVHHAQDGQMPDRQPSDDAHKYWLLTITKARLGHDKQIYPSHDFGLSIDLSPCFLTLLLNNTIPQINDNDDFLFDYYPFFLLSYTDFIARSTGMRAPPVC